MKTVTLTGLPYKGKIPLRDVVVNPIIEQGEDARVHCSGNGKMYKISLEELKKPLYSIPVTDFKHKSSTIHQLHYYPMHEV